MTKIKILIADDHAIVRFGLTSLFSSQKDMKVVGQVENGEEAVRLAMETQPDVIVMDLVMPVMDGSEATEILHERLPSANILILTSYGSADGVAKAVAAGAKGVLTKADDDSALIPVVRRLAAGERFFAPEIERYLRENPPVPPLSARQQTILDSLTLGRTNRDISVQLGIREDSVAKHIKALLDKIGAANRAEAVAIALKKHLLKM